MDADQNFESPVAEWLNVKATSDPCLFKHTFREGHIGNPWIRSIHGGVTGGLSEFCAEASVLRHDPKILRCETVTNSVNYLKATRDDDCHIRTNVYRITKRLAFVDVICWQDSEDQPVTRANCIIRVFR